jgi:hypothetical protein
MPHGIAVNENLAAVGVCWGVLSSMVSFLGTWVERLRAFGSHALRF